MFNYVPEKEEKLKELMELAKSREKQSEQRAEEEGKGQQLNVVPHTLADMFNKNSHIGNKVMRESKGCMENFSLNWKMFYFVQTFG